MYKMKIMRKTEVLVDGERKCFKIGDQIHVGEYYTATCQKVGKNGAIFMFDQYLDKARMMNVKETNEGGYEASDLRKFLKEFATSSLFDGIREMMVPFKKTGDLLRIPTAEEVFGPEKAHEYYEILSFKNQWPLMKDYYNRLAFRRHRDGWYKECGWLQNKDKNSDSHFAVIDGYGGSEYCKSYGIIGVRVVFRLLV